MGNVGINTDQSSEALTIHGNIQLTGAVLQPSDLRLKEVIRELDSGHQLENVNKLKIVQYQYKPEFINKANQQNQTWRHQPNDEEEQVCIAGMNMKW